MFFVLFPPPNDGSLIPHVIIKPEHYAIEITGLQDTYLVGEPYSFSYILYGFGDPCGGIHITFPINKTDSAGTGWIPSCLKTIQRDFVLDIRKDQGTTYGHIALQETGNYTVTVQFEKGSNGPTVATKNFLVVDVVPRGNLFLQQPLRIEGLNDTYSVGQKIEFTVKFNGTKYGCYTHPTLRIDDSNHQKVWEGNYILELCDPDTTPIHFEKIWSISDSNLGVPILNKTGTYTLFAEFEKNIIQQDFMVKQEIAYANPCKESNNLDLEKIPLSGEPSRLVFSVKQNTTAHICIKYSSNLDNEGALNLNAEFDNGYLGTYNGTKSNVSVTTNPSFIPLQKGQSTIADYVISVPQDADGVYWLGVSQMCDRIPIITTNHKIIPDDIPVIVGIHGCPAISLDAKIIGYSNADAQYHTAKALPGR